MWPGGGAGTPDTADFVGMYELGPDGMMPY